MKIFLILFLLSVSSIMAQDKKKSFAGLLEECKDKLDSCNKDNEDITKLKNDYESLKKEKEIWLYDKEKIKKYYQNHSNDLQSEINKMKGNMNRINLVKSFFFPGWGLIDTHKNDLGIFYSTLALSGYITIFLSYHMYNANKNNSDIRGSTETFVSSNAVVSFFDVNRSNDSRLAALYLLTENRFKEETTSNSLELRGKAITYFALFHVFTFFHSFYLSSNEIPKSSFSLNLYKNNADNNLKIEYQFRF